jgi:hypothetical protein
MSQRPCTLGNLLQRLTSPREANIRCWGPIIASLAPHKAAGGINETPTWAILHSISDWEVQLIHPQPLKHRQFDVEINAVGGEVIRFVLSVGRSVRIRDLYQTSASVPHQARTRSSYPTTS